MRAGALWSCALGVAVTTGTSFWLERYQPWALALALLFLAGLAVSGGYWRTRRPLCLLLAANVLLVFLYLWSLDDSVHVSIQATPAGINATVDGQALTPLTQYRGGYAGLMAGSAVEYRVRATGEFPDGTDYSQGPLPREHRWLADFGQDVRLAEPTPAWANIAIEEHPGNGQVVPIPLSIAPGSGWGRNVRGEVAGNPGTVLTLAGPLRGSYTISADLMRADGTQGILLGGSRAGSGYVLEVRMDQPDALWFSIVHGQIGQPLGGAFLHVQTIPMIQRDVRLLLGNVIGAFAVIALLSLVYLFLVAALRLAGQPDVDELAGLLRLIARARVAHTLAAVLSAAGLLATALIASSLLQRIPHVQDSVAYLFQAKTLALGRLSVPDPRPPIFFTEEFIPVHGGQWFGKYPPGWPVLLAIGVLVHAPWLVDPVLAAIDLAVIYLIGREVYGVPVALLGTALALSSPFFLFLGGSFMAHTSTLFYLSAGIYLVIRWVRRVERREPVHDLGHLLPAGFLLGMAFLTRQLDAVAFVAPFLFLTLFPAIRPRLLAARWLLLGAAVPGVCLLLYNRALTGNPFLSPYSLWWPFDRIGFGPNVGMSGHTLGQGLWNTSFNLEMLLAHLFGWPFYLTLALVAVPFVLGRAGRWDALFAASAGAIVIAYIFYWAPGVMYGPRYYYVAIPWLALLSARGFQELYRWFLRLPVASDRLAALLATGLLLAGLLAYNLTVYLPLQVSSYHGYNDISADSLDAVQRANIHHALIFVVTNPPATWWSYGAVFSANSPLLDGDIVYARDEGVADRELMRRFPGRTYYRLDATTLTRVG